MISDEVAKVLVEAEAEDRLNWSRKLDVRRRVGSLLPSPQQRSGRCMGDMVVSLVISSLVSRNFPLMPVISSGLRYSSPTAMPFLHEALSLRDLCACAHVHVYVFVCTRACERACLHGGVFMRALRARLSSAQSREDVGNSFVFCLLVLCEAGNSNEYCAYLLSPSTLKA